MFILKYLWCAHVLSDFGARLLVGVAFSWGVRSCVLRWYHGGTLLLLGQL